MVFHLADIVDKEPVLLNAGPGGEADQFSTAGRSKPLRLHTSPSHRFFPFLQAVQARAPLLGMCP